MKHELPDLPYDYSELEPVISAEIMELHHSKHHNAYVTNLNIALEKYAEAEAKGDVATMIAMQGAIKFNGGGHVNHSIFWTNLAPQSKGGGEPPKGDLADAINNTWGSLPEATKVKAPERAAVFAARTLVNIPPEPKRPACWLHICFRRSSSDETSDCKIASEC